jgi:hypothetical protein
MEKTVDRESIIFRIIIFIATCGIILLGNSLSVLADSSLNTHKKDPFFGEKIIDPSWGLSKTDPSWNPSQPWYHQILDDWNGPVRPQYIRGETWMGTQNYPDKDHVASTTIQYVVYRFGTEKAAQQYLENIFKKENILIVQDTAQKFSKKKSAEIDLQIKKKIGQWKTYAIGGMTVPNAGVCQRDNFFNAGYSFKILSRKEHSYAIDHFAYKTRLKSITEVNKFRREYRYINKGNKGEKFISDEKRGIYLQKQNYILLVTVSCNRMTNPWDAGMTNTNGCNFKSTAKEVPFREDIWSHIMSLHGTGISINKLAPDSDADGVPDDQDICCTTPKGVKVNKLGCPKCVSGKIYDPSSVYANPITGCSPKMAIMFTTYSDPEIDWRHKLAIGVRYGHISEFFKSKGYTIISIEIGTDGLEKIVEYLIKPSTKAIAFFGHGGIRIKEKPFWWDDYNPSLGSYQTPALSRKSKEFAKKYYENNYCLSKKEVERKATMKANNIALDYAYIFACHSLDNNDLRDFLISPNGIYWGEPGVLTGTCPLILKKGRSKGVKQ